MKNLLILVLICAICISISKENLDEIKEENLDEIKEENVDDRKNTALAMSFAVLFFGLMAVFNLFIAFNKIIHSALLNTSIMKLRNGEIKTEEECFDSQISNIGIIRRSEDIEVKIRLFGCPLEFICSSEMIEGEMINNHDNVTVRLKAEDSKVEIANLKVREKRPNPLRVLKNISRPFLEYIES